MRHYAWFSQIGSHVIVSVSYFSLFTAASLEGVSVVSWRVSVTAINHLMNLVTGEADMFICTAWHGTPPRSIIPLATDSS